MKKISLLLLSWCLMISMLGGLLPAYANAAQKGSVTVPEAIDTATAYIMDIDGGSLSDWDAYALAKAGKPVPPSYLTSVSAQIGQNGALYSKVTDYARISLGVKAAGGDPEHITAGSQSYNLIQGIYNSDVLTAQGTNGGIYALLALNSGTYSIPLTAKWTPDKITAWLLTQQNADGGWPLSAGGASSIDITAATLQALSAYRTNGSVKPAIDRAVQWLSSQQLANGGFSEYGENAESTAQVIIALSALSQDAKGASFTKPNGNPLSYLFGYRQADGGFAHVTGGTSDIWATGQSLMALAAYDRFTGGNSGSYDAILLSGGATAPSSASVTVHVEGPAGTVAEGTTVAGNAFDALAQVLNAKGIALDATTSKFVNSIGGISNKSDWSAWWGYNVKRQGVWDYANANNLGLASYLLHNGDEIYVYYTAYDTTLVKSITVDPQMPFAGQPLHVKVEQTVWDWVYNRENTTVAASVYVELGGQKAVADSQGIAHFASGLPGGTYEAVVTGNRSGTAPTIIKDKKTIQIGSADIQIEGVAKTYAAGLASSINLLDSVTQLLSANQIPYKVSNNYLESIGSEAYGWMYAVNNQGKWKPITGGMNTYVLQPGDQAVIYYSGFDPNWNATTYLVDSIITNPVQPKANESFTVTVNKSLGAGTPVSPAAGVKLSIGGLTAATNDQGTATFAGLPEGTHNLDISGYVFGSTPTIVHTVQPITIQPRSGNTGGGTVPSNPVVSLSVTGDSGLGTVLSSTSVNLQSGDTPYSILIRTLGAGRVKSSGSGSTAYVQGIDGLSEFDRGPLSGWMYAVNCTYLSQGADTIILKSGDSVSWLYTLDGGKDLNACSGSAGAIGAAVPAVQLTASVLDAELKKLGLSYDNQKPIQEIAQPTVVLNASKLMTGSTADTLKKVLAANTVRLQKPAAADQETTVADEKKEVQLQIPSGALKADTNITVNELSESDRSDLVSPMYELGPKGQTFEKPIYISIQIPLTVGSLNQLALAWLNEKTGQWVPIPAVIDAESGTVTGLVNHFTKFAVIDKSKVTAASAVPSAAIQVGTAIEQASGWLKSGTHWSDWSAYAQSKAGVAVQADYLTSVEAKLQENNGVFRNVTDYERLALSVQAAGGNPESIAGYNLIERIYNNDRMEVQGSNGPIYGLLALSSGSYKIPSDVKWTPEKLLQWILDVQNSDGSWSLAKGEGGIPDMTGAALAALAPYQDRASVKQAKEKAVQWLAANQSGDGGYALEGTVNAESTAQVIWGLTVVGIDPIGSPFKSGDNSMLKYLLGLQLTNGAFPHISGGEAEAISTEQALMALGAYQVYTKQAPAGPVPAASPAYADWKDIASWALPFVDKARVYGIMEGTGGSIPAFEPKGQVTRAQFTAMLLRLLGEAPAASAVSGTGFTDVAPDAWYAAYVKLAVAKGVVEGVGDDRFAPDVAITRQQMAIMLARALKLQASGGVLSSGTFIDLDQAYSGAAPLIEAVRQKGLMEGDEAGRFLPLDTATREMAAAVAVRAYELTKKP